MLGHPQVITKHELASLLTTKTIAAPVILELDLVQEDPMMTQTPVETRRLLRQIMETNTSKPWDTFWCSDVKSKVFQRNGCKVRPFVNWTMGKGNLLSGRSE